MKILVIEDDQNISKLTKEIFMRTLHDVVLSPGVISAKKALSVEDFDLIILDMVLNDGNGGDILRYMVENNINIPVFIHSGYSKKFSIVIDYYKEIGLIHRVYEKPSLFSKDTIQQINSVL